jgi:CubicO group peptidase (beta-lactamase class C family)
MNIGHLKKSVQLAEKRFKIPGYAKILVFLSFLVAGLSCSEKTVWDGFWQAEMEEFPDFVTVAEIELRKNSESDEWRGTYRNPEMMDIADFHHIDIEDSSIKMNLGRNFSIHGALSKEADSFRGVLYLADSAIDTVTFTRGDDWTIPPARIGENGQPVHEWHYKAPEETGDGWSVSALQDTGMDLHLFGELFQSVIDGTYPGLDAVLIAHDGQLMVEEYFHYGRRDRIHSLQSVTKSVTSLIVGMAYDEGLIHSLEKPVRNFFPEYKDFSRPNPWSASLRHTLMMSAALEWNEQDIPYSDPKNNAVQMNNSSDMINYVLSRESKNGEQPGEQFYYNSGLSILLSGVLKDATGMTADEYAEKTLFRELGIDDYQWGSLNGTLHTGGGLFLRPRDLLKLGQMVLNSGRWKEEQVISESWIQESTALHLQIAESDNAIGYGYQWWIGEFRAGDNRHETVYASGHGGQFLWIVPELDLVVAALHHIPVNTEDIRSFYWEEMEQIVIPAVL